MIATPCCAGEALLGEGPRWVRTASGDRLVWVDLLNALVLGRGADGRAAELWRAPEPTVSAVIPLESGGFAVAMHRSIALVDDRWVLRSTLPLAGLPEGLRLSDATAGPDGALWVGAVPAQDGAAVPGALYRVTPDGAAVAAGDIGFSNGIGFRADGRRLLLIDSTANTLSEYAVDPATGALGSARVLYAHDVPGQALDGLAVDAEDRVWAAVFGGRTVLGIDPAGGVFDRVEVPATRVTSCAFGPDGRLYVTTATVERTEAERAAEPAAGSVFVAAPGVAGGRVWKGAIA